MIVARAAGGPLLLAGGRVLAGGTVLIGLAGCGLPYDAEGTLDRIRGGTLRAGLVEAPPWAGTGQGRPAGVEVDLVERLAGDLGAEVTWIEGAEHELVPALAQRALDLVVGGLDSRSPWSAEVALTRSYLTTRVVVAVPAGAPAPADTGELEGVGVLVEDGSEAAGLLAAAGAVPQPVPRLQPPAVAAHDGPVAVEDWRVATLDLQAGAAEVSSTDHVWAVPLGENGWQVAVERFLLSQPAADLADALRAADVEGG